VERSIRSVSVVFCPRDRERSNVKFTGEDLFVTYTYLAIPFGCGMLNLYFAFFLFFFFWGGGGGGGGGVWFFKLES
jgi:hypothetical protein